jgi:hypothetical protein
MLALEIHGLIDEAIAKLACRIVKVPAKCGRGRAVLFRGDARGCGADRMIEKPKETP